MKLLLPLFKKKGINFVFDPEGTYSYQNIEVGNDVFIGSGAVFLASRTGIKIGNKVMFGPNVTIIGGDHNVSKIGKYMFDVKDKLPENDKQVVICDDVWVGASVTILKGVIVGQGAIVAAGSLVIKDVPEYAVVGGIPAKVLKMRFSDEDLLKHRNLLNR